jgi:hypothetical protein
VKIFSEKPFLGKERKAVFPIPLRPLFMYPEKPHPSSAHLPQIKSSPPTSSFFPKNPSSEILITD